MINNKNGFAITALLYGLSIMALMVVALMMSVMQNSRKNSSSLVRSIEEELNAYGETAQQYTSGSHDYYVPEGQTGYFKILNAKYHLYNILIKGACILLILVYPSNQ